MIRKALLVAALPLAFVSCTKLDEEFKGSLAPDQVGGGAIDVAALLRGTYNSMQTNFQDQSFIYALTEMSTDELIGPTRGPDWDDNGVWRVIHEHKWDAENTRIRDTYNNLLGTVYSATNLLQFSPSAQQAAEARLLRAISNFYILDLYDQTPYRDPGESTLEAARVRKGAEAWQFIVDELNEILPNLPDGPKGTANKNAARVLLMKMYLNKGVWASTEQRNAPTFDAADMNQVIALADVIINSNLYSFTPNFFDNFSPNNSTLGTENIFTRVNDVGVSGSTGATVRAFWHAGLHYNMNPSGWNGFSTLTDLYNRFEATDKRRGASYNQVGGPANPGNRINVGILTGQQYNLATDAPLTNRAGAPLVFTPDVNLIETDVNTLEQTGYRAYKYPIDYVNTGDGNVGNDYVFFRLADVLLMKAEAILRGGTGTVAGVYGSTPLALVNSIRTQVSRGASALASVDLDVLLDERSRELYLESWRRQDLIRFGKFLQPFGKKGQSDPKYLVYAIPNQQLAVNPNLTPNPGY
ncbi:MAG: RagB/SusD family nutrient uptake outer membrane protein [Chitinophagaceae bacterium]|nr:MAG: RagB/SusD family nutrient uptake outer membrane protein [Chitinophagaceae bacterium]